VFYGHNHIPERSEKSGGGIIKCQDLNAIFPNTKKNANILYLVSSALPYFAPLMVRIAKKKGARLVWNQNGVAYPGWHGPGWGIFNRDMQDIIQMADYVIYQSEFCKVSADKYLGKYNGSSTILNNPIDTELFFPSKKLPEGKTLLLAGSHEHFYRVRCALEMMVHLRKMLPEVKMTIAGRYLWQNETETAMKEAKDYADKIGVTDVVTFCGSYSQNEVVTLMQSNHLLVHTKYNDPCPRLVCEAMACGLPIVFSASGGMMELVGSSAGIGVDAPVDWENDHPPDPFQLAGAAYKIFANYQEYRKNARARVESKLDLQAWLNSHREIFNQLVS